MESSLYAKQNTHFSAYVYWAIEIGRDLLANGAEAWRVEDTVRRILEAYGAREVDVFSITSSLVVTATVEDEKTYTQTRRVASIHNDMMKIDELNELSRLICSEKIPPGEIRLKMEKIRLQNGYPKGVIFMAYALIAGAFTVFFGGNLRDFLAAAFIGFLLCGVELFIRRGTANPLLTAFLWSLVGGILCSLSVKIGLGVHRDLISIGNIMLFIPGIAFTNSIRDLFSGDTISGLIRVLESLILAAVIAFGFTCVGFIM